MKDNSLQNTVLVWTKNKTIIKYTSEIANEMKFELLKADCGSDLIAAPCFLMIIDAEKLTDDFLSSFNKLAKCIDWNCSILVYGKKISNIPSHVNKLISFYNKPFTKSFIKNKVLEGLKSKKVLKKDIFRKIIFRLITLYKMLDKEIVIPKDACDIFEISDRTLRRDIKILRDVCEGEILFNKKTGYQIKS